MNKESWKKPLKTALQTIVLGTSLALTPMAANAEGNNQATQAKIDNSIGQLTPQLPDALTKAQQSKVVEDTKATLDKWNADKVDPSTIKPQILDLSVAYFADQLSVGGMPTNPKIARDNVVYLSSEEYNKKSASNCQDKDDVNSQNEAWLMHIMDEKLYINDGVKLPQGATSSDLFFRYIVGMFNLAPFKLHYAGVTTENGSVAHYEKGLLLLGDAPTLGQQMLNLASGKIGSKAVVDCFWLYRPQLNDAMSASLAKREVEPLNINLTNTNYSQRKSAEVFQIKVLAPYFSGIPDNLAGDYLYTLTRPFYKDIGSHLVDQKKEVGKSDQQVEADEIDATDKYFRQIYPQN